MNSRAYITQKAPSIQNIFVATHSAFPSGSVVMPDDVIIQLICTGHTVSDTHCST